VQRAAVGGQDFPGNEKSELHPCRCAALLQPSPSEQITEILKRRSGDRCALVVDCYGHAVVLTPNGQHDRFSLRAVLNRVRHEIGNNLAQLDAVGVAREVTFVNHFKMLARMRSADLFDHRFAYFLQICRCQHDRDRVLEPSASEVQQVMTRALIRFALVLMRVAADSTRAGPGYRVSSGIGLIVRWRSADFANHDRTWRGTGPANDATHG